MPEDGKEAEKRRLADALRANLKRRKAVPRPAAPEGEPEKNVPPARGDDRG